MREKEKFSMNLFRDRQQKDMKFDLEAKLFAPININVFSIDLHSGTDLPKCPKEKLDYISLNEIIINQ